MISRATRRNDMGFCHGMLLWLGAPHKPLLLVGREHGRTIPLADIAHFRGSPATDCKKSWSTSLDWSVANLLNSR